MSFVALVGHPLRGDQASPAVVAFSLIDLIVISSAAGCKARQMITGITATCIFLFLFGAVLILLWQVRVLWFGVGVTACCVQ